VGGAARLGDRVAPGRLYRGRSPAERRAERRRRLLDTGLAQFGTVGYGATSIERLCAAAGVTPRHFYDELPSREALLVAVYEEVVEAATAAVAAALAAAGPDPRSRAEAALGAFAHTMLDDPRRARVACVEVVGVSPSLERRRREVLHGFARVVEAQASELAAEGRIPPRDFRLGALALVGGTNELLVDWVLTTDPPPVARLITELVELFVAAARPRPER
jgi:AcrR family transcriptional regulator